MTVLMAALALFAPAVHAAESTSLYRPDGDGTGYGYSDFGRTLDIEGNRMVIGAAGTQSAYVYRFVDGEWQHAATLPTPVNASFDTDMAVALGGDVIVVGVTSATVDGIENAGTVFVFEQGETAAAWQEVARLRADAPVVDGQFGSRVAFEGGRILVSGWPANDPAGYLFERDAGGEWVLTRKFSGADGSGLIVNDVAIDGGRIAFANRTRGGVHVYERGAAAWVASDFLPHAEAMSVVLEGDVLVVGAPFEDLGEFARSEGAAHVYEYANGEWQPIVRLHSPYENAYGYFGIRMDLQDGLLVVGEGHETGAWFAFRKNEVGEWMQFDGHGSGSMHGIVHVPAISGRNLAIGYAGMGFERVDLYAVAELMSDGEDPGDEVATLDDGTETVGDDTGTDEGDDASGNVANGDSGDTNDVPDGGDDAGDALAGSTAVSGSGGDEQAAGGGVAGWLALLAGLLSLAGRKLPPSGKEDGRVSGIRSARRT